MLHVFIGTKAQYVKMAPLLWRMDSNGVDYRLIDSGQHADLASSFRDELGLRAPDIFLGQSGDVNSIPQAVMWTLRLAARFGSRARLRDEVFGGHRGVCLVHGDTPTTLLSTLMARRAGLAVAHVEAGLRTYRWFHPFPEEIVRVMVGRLAEVLFAPSSEAANNLRRSGVKGRIVEQAANTVVESVRSAIDGSSTGVGGLASPDEEAVPDEVASDTATSDEVISDAETSDATLKADRSSNAEASVVVTMHRVENLHRRSRREGLINLVESLAQQMPVCWVMHGPTERAVSTEARRRLAAAGAELRPLLSHGAFLRLAARARFVITDGGSIQEECALLGVPTLVWRDRTDRDDGLGANVVLSHYDPFVTQAFLNNPEQYRRPMTLPSVSPSAQILDVLDEWR